MSSIFFNAAVGDDARRQQLYQGHLFMYSPTPSALQLVELAREMIGKAFGRRDPECAQHDMPGAYPATSSFVPSVPADRFST